MHRGPDQYPGGPPMPRIPFALAFAVTFAACSDPRLEPELAPLPFESQPIVYGAATGAMSDSATPARHKATVSLHELARGGTAVYVSPFCSGTLIAGDVVLTAAHCVKRRGISADKVAVYVGNNPTARDQNGSYDVVKHLYDVVELSAHPDYDSQWLLNDIALLRLGASPVEADPMPFLRAANGFTPTDVGSALDFVGFGEDEDGASGVKLHGEGTLGGLGCSVSGCPWSGDVDTQLSYAQGTNGGATEGEPGPCFGDSGGPAYLLRGDGWYVGGITSYGDGECDVYGVSTRTDAYEAFLDAFVGGSGGASDAGVGDDGGSSACGDEVCGAGESCDGRDGTTACPQDCDGVTKGRPWDRYCYVAGSCVGDGCP